MRFLRQTSDNSSIGTSKELISAPDATSDNAWRNLDRSKSVAAVDGIKETLSFAHCSALIPYARVSASRAYVTCGKVALYFITDLVIHNLHFKKRGVKYKIPAAISRQK